MISILYLIESLETEEQKNTARDLYERYVNMVYSQAERYCSAQEDTDDIVQDTFVRVIKNIDKFTNKPEYEIKAMLKIYVYHVAMTLYNKQKKNRVVEFNELLEYENQEENEDATQYEEQLSINDNYDFDAEINSILKYMRILKEIDRQILIFKFHNQYTVREIAKELDMPESTVSTRLNRALARIKNNLKDGNHE